MSNCEHTNPDCSEIKPPCPTCRDVIRGNQTTVVTYSKIRDSCKQRARECSAIGMFSFYIFHDFFIGLIKRKK